MNPTTLPTIAARAVLCALAIVGFGACSPYIGSASSVRPDSVRADRGWLVVDHVPLVRQRSEHDCGTAALAMVVAHYSQAAAADPFFAHPKDQKIAARELRDQARRLGFDAFVVEGNPQDLVHELEQGRPVIVGVAKPTIQDAVAHYQVLVGLHRDSKRVALLDPAEGWLQNSFEGFLREWQASERVLLLVLPKAQGSQLKSVDQ